MRSMELERVLGEARKTFVSGKTRSFEWRQSQLKALQRLLEEEEDDICKALKLDIGKHRLEAFRDEVGVLIKSVDFALANLKAWMAPEKVRLPLVSFPATAELVPEPLGLILVFSSWNYPIGLSLEPLIGAISAGNTVVIKPSEHSPACSEFLANIVPRYLDNKAVKVIQGGPHIAEKLLEHKWDKIFFTGNARIGRTVMAAAAKNLTPVALELGGKCPAIVDYLSSFRDRRVAMGRIVGGKWAPCAGQACIGIDYMLVQEEFAPIVVEMLKATIKKFYTKPDYLSTIVNKQHFQRLSNLLKDPRVAASIVHGGSQNVDKLFIEPTILLDPPLDAAIMNEEIFGPLLPIITLKKIEDSIEFIRDRPSPLVIYAFTKDEKLKRLIVEGTSSGSVTFNDTMVQYACDVLPFGGVGQSGFGQYHGKFSFDLFTHRKAVLRRSFLIDFSFRYPPWNENKLQFMRYVFKYDYFGLFRLLLGLKR